MHIVDMEIKHTLHTSGLDGGEWAVSHPSSFMLQEGVPGAICIIG